MGGRAGIGARDGVLNRIIKETNPKEKGKVGGKGGARQVFVHGGGGGGKPVPARSHKAGDSQLEVEGGWKLSMHEGPRESHKQPLFHPSVLYSVGQP